MEKSFPGGCCWKNWPQDDGDVDVTNYSSRAYTHTPTHTGGGFRLFNKRDHFYCNFFLSVPRHRFSSLFIFHRVKKHTHSRGDRRASHGGKTRHCDTALFPPCLLFWHELFIYFPFLCSPCISTKNLRGFSLHIHWLFLIDARCKLKPHFHKFSFSRTSRHFLPFPHKSFFDRATRHPTHTHRMRALRDYNNDAS